MKSSFITVLGILIALQVNSEIHARSSDKCDGLTGRERSRCLNKERQDRQDNGIRDRENSRSTTSPPSSSAVSRPSVPRSTLPGSSSAPGAVVAGNRVTISWSSVSGAAEYDFGIRDMTSNQLVIDTRTSGTSYTARIDRGRTYRWNVRACNAAGCSAFTTALYFQTEGDVFGGVVPPAIEAISLPASFPLYDQHDAGNSQLYVSREWASAPDPAGGPRTRYTCLSTVYAMIQHARGYTEYRVGGLWNGEPTWDNSAGAANMEGLVSRGSVGTVEPILAQFRQGNPVVLWGPLPNDAFGHFVLAVGTDSRGRIIVHDPSGGKRVTVDPITWRVSGGSILSRIEKYRTVTF